ncbi:antibiotic biosynthesis monooxygenase family protein [Streptomyces sp. RKAG290]|uniref:antibiotic biosynthesis monooxygenase family protein n=1 Tax=Streptomyces sp. RKAG290 TaxID=2888348 RepID=UPI0020333819|nr:antibiotic biosynthesis monooxygenase family protein [Streptomyces sp. RKAG290]MCM2414176.1 antibiotic biosynthesis monooxygenase [Streptomyces sp. RKAG290]
MSFTVINTFTLKDPADAEAFEARFLTHVEWMRSRPGFLAHQAVRAADRPEVYVNLGWWERPEDFQAVLASDTFKEHAEEFHRIVDVDADPSMGLMRLDGAAGGRGDALSVDFLTVGGDRDAFVAAWRAYATAAAELEGFVAADLAASLFARPGGFTALTRWRSAGAADAARLLPAYAAVAELAEVRTVPAAHLAGDRAPFAPAGA